MTPISGFKNDCASKMTCQAGWLSSQLQKTLFKKSENRFIGSFDAFKGSNIKKSL